MGRKKEHPLGERKHELFLKTFQKHLHMMNGFHQRGEKGKVTKRKKSHHQQKKCSESPNARNPDPRNSDSANPGPANPDHQDNQSDDLF